MPGGRSARAKVLLLRGTTQPEDESEPATVVQGIVEVDTVIRTTGSMLGAMDLSSVGRLSTTPLDSGDDGAHAFRCGPEESSSR